MPLSFSVRRLDQNGRPIFIGALNGKQLLDDNVKVDTWFAGTGKGYQRTRTEKKIGRIADFLNEDEGTMPTSILVSIRSKGVKFNQLKGSRGKLVVPSGSSINIVDGQHRVWGLRKAIEKQKGHLDFEIPTTFICPAM